MALHLRGPVLLGDERVVGEAWVVGERVTFERPAGGGDDELDGWVLPGLVDVGPRQTRFSGCGRFALICRSGATPIGYPCRHFFRSKA